VHLADPGHRGGCGERVSGERVGDGLQLLDVPPDDLVLGAETLGEGGVRRGQRRGGGHRSQRAQRVEAGVGYADGELIGLGDPAAEADIAAGPDHDVRRQPTAVRRHHASSPPSKCGRSSTSSRRSPGSTT
jgi:hypothetical protein